LICKKVQPISKENERNTRRISDIIKSRYLFSEWGVEKWEGQTSAVFSTISSEKIRTNNILSIYGRKEGLR
jgi:hypothetical protein